ncbi:hypothetical protein [Yinghuangia soli]|uniref:Uncharacterized protein n=1 Tax=Yinghuangia soli TaxID=2908204 RepID=A0AA41TZW5_9ACTN|nr:hypothetical protein [Yinghuangia soli]MCF2529228.1 hypothetical protein [Yinghuangia soli]
MTVPTMTVPTMTVPTMTVPTMTVPTMTVPTTAADTTSASDKTSDTTFILARLVLLPFSDLRELPLLRPLRPRPRRPHPSLRCLPLPKAWVRAAVRAL